jgi:hypothetical protein
VGTQQSHRLLPPEPEEADEEVFSRQKQQQSTDTEELKTGENVSVKNIILQNTKQNFKAGKVKTELKHWMNITKDEWILNTIQGYRLEVNRSPCQITTPRPYKFNQSEITQIQTELNTFLQVNIIEEVDSVPEEGEFISNIFYRPKPNNAIRIILNLKPFNLEYIDTIHFKMETLHTAIAAMRKNCWFASIDLADAFYSIPVHEKDRKYLRFYFQNCKYQFCALPMGLGSSPRVFSKVLKPVYANLRTKGHISTAYIDDSCLQGNTKEQCLKNVFDTMAIFDSLGLTINIEKSVLEPCQKIIFLGFILCSVTMTIRLTETRRDEIRVLCQQLLSKRRTNIRHFAKLIGKLVAAIPGVEYAPLYIKPLERIKEQELKNHRGNYNSFMTIPNSQIPILNWWVDNVSHAYKKISHGTPTIVLYSDASKHGWGGFNKTTGNKTGGLWSSAETELHINVLELKAAELTVKAFCKEHTNTHIHIFMDNTSSVAYLNNFGGRISELHEIARNLWLWCIERKLHISVAHVPGIENTNADELSRCKNDDTEWSLRKSIFNKIFKLHPTMDTDLFASRLNKQLPQYVSRFPDHGAYKIDAFTFPWENKLYYMYPPFSLLPRVLQKIAQDAAEAVLVCPIWPTQPWWPSLVPMICAECYLLPQSQEILILTHKPEQVHPLQKMRLAVFRLSGRSSKAMEFQSQQETLFFSLGEAVPKNNMTFILENGLLTAKNQLIPLNPI